MLWLLVRNAVMSCKNKAGSEVNPRILLTSHSTCGRWEIQGGYRWFIPLPSVWVPRYLMLSVTVVYWLIHRGCNICVCCMTWSYIRPLLGPNETEYHRTVQWSDLLSPRAGFDMDSWNRQVWYRRCWYRLYSRIITTAHYARAVWVWYWHASDSCTLLSLGYRRVSPVVYKSSLSR